VILPTAAVAFAVAAVLGFVLLTYVLRGLPTPKGLALVHGAFAAAGIGLLLVRWAGDGPAPMLALGVFVAAAAGGFFLIYRDLVHGRVPKTIAVGHGLVAVTALVLLLVYLLR